MGIRYHMRLMGEAAGVPVSFFYTVLCLNDIDFAYKNLYV